MLFFQISKGLSPSPFWSLRANIFPMSWAPYLKLLLALHVCGGLPAHSTAHPPYPALLLLFIHKAYFLWLYHIVHTCIVFTVCLLQLEVAWGLGAVCFVHWQNKVPSIVPSSINTYWMNTFQKRLERLPLFLLLAHFMMTGSMTILLIALYPMPRKASCV